MNRTTGLLIAVSIVLAIIGYAVGRLSAPATVPATVTATQTYTTTATYTTTVTSPPVTTTVTTTTSAASMASRLEPVAAASVTVNASRGATLRAGPIIVVIRPGTYVQWGNRTYSSYVFSLVLYRVVGVQESPDGAKPVYAFAFAVNGTISPAISLVDSSGKPMPVVTLAFIPPNWSSWTWLGYQQEPNGTLVGGKYAFKNQWLALGGGISANIAFFKPVPWVFTAGDGNPQLQFSTYVPSVNATGVKGLMPIEIAEAEINGTIGGAVRAGNIIAVVPPGTYLSTPNGVKAIYNFSLVYYAVQDVPGVLGMAPLGAYAFAANGEVTAQYTFVDSSGRPAPIVTVAFFPRSVTTWTWLSGSPARQDAPLINGTYRFPNVWTYGDGYMVNTQFVKPVPWVFLAPYK
ncbi:MAG: hypothetical protein ABWJ97_08020 [Thermoproteus sp.]